MIKKKTREFLEAEADRFVALEMDELHGALLDVAGRLFDDPEVMKSSTALEISVTVTGTFRRAILRRLKVIEESLHNQVQGWQNSDL